MRVSLGMAHIREQGPDSPEHLHAERPGTRPSSLDQPERNDLGKVAAGMSLVAFAFGWIPIGGIVFGLLFGLPAVALGWIGMSRARALGGWRASIFGFVLGVAVVAWKLTPDIRMF